MDGNLNSRTDVVVHDDAVRARLTLDQGQLDLLARALEVARPHLEEDNDQIAELHGGILRAMYMVERESSL